MGKQLEKVLSLLKGQTALHLLESQTFSKKEDIQLFVWLWKLNLQRQLIPPSVYLKMKSMFKNHTNDKNSELYQRLDEIRCCENKNGACKYCLVMNSA